jgi:hypothetical protein
VELEPELIAQQRDPRLAPGKRVLGPSQCRYPPARGLYSVFLAGEDVMEAGILVQRCSIFN